MTTNNNNTNYVLPLIPIMFTAILTMLATAAQNNSNRKIGITGSKKHKNEQVQVKKIFKKLGP